MLEILLKVIHIIVPVFSVVLVGYVYARSNPAQAKAQMQPVNQLVTSVLAPLMMLGVTAQKSFDVMDNLPLIWAGLWVMAGAVLSAYVVAKLFRIDVKTIVPTNLYNNCGNMGLPLSLLAFGAVGLGQAGVLLIITNIMYFSLGVYILTGGKTQASLWTTPMMLSMALGLLLSFAGVNLPGVMQKTLDFFTQASIVLMLFSLGVRLLDLRWTQVRVGFIGGVLSPVSGLLFAYLAYYFGLFGMSAQQTAAVMLYSSLPPAVFCFIIAEQYNQEPDKVAAMVLVGNLLAVVFVPIGLFMGLSIAR